MLWKKSRERFTQFNMKEYCFNFVTLPRLLTFVKACVTRK